MSVRVAEPVVVTYDELLRGGGELNDRISAAFGYDGLGIIVVSNVPGVDDARRALLPLAPRFAALPDEVKEKYVHEQSFFAFGWSHGKEKLQSGMLDTGKGSFYANPQYDNPVDDEELIRKFPALVHPNIWPTEDLPELEAAFKNLGQLIVDTGKHVARHCDNYVHSQLPGYASDRLERIISESRCAKGRLLHYFPRAEGAPASAAGASDFAFSDWCGWHNDHGSLTGLVTAMFMDAEGREVPNEDPEAGLYVSSRQGSLVHVRIPAGGLAFQIGETAQVHSGGLLQATPHAVRGTSVPGVSRSTMAVFMEPMMGEPMDVPAGRSLEDTQSASAAEALPAGVPPLASRWELGQDFGQFTERTLGMFYDTPEGAEQGEVAAPES